MNFRIVKLSKASIIGQSTFGMKETEGGEFEELQIRDASKAVSEVLRNIKDKTEVDLLHVNCEVSRNFIIISLFSYSFKRAVNGRCLRI